MHTHSYYSMFIVTYFCCNINELGLYRRLGVKPFEYSLQKYYEKSYSISLYNTFILYKYITNILYIMS